MVRRDLYVAAPCCRAHHVHDRPGDGVWNSEVWEEVRAHPDARGCSCLCLGGHYLFLRNVRFCFWSIAVDDMGTPPGMAERCISNMRSRYHRSHPVLSHSNGVARGFYGWLSVGFTIRAFEPVDYWLPSIVKSLKGSHLLYVLRFIFLPVNYFLELGFFAIAAVLFWMWRRSLGTPLAREESLLTSLALGSVLICTFVRSTVRWNDLGWRGFLVAQFVLLLWGIPVVQAVLDRSGKDPSIAIMSRWRVLTIFCLVIGLAGTVVEMFNFRANFAGPQTPLTIEMAETYDWISQHTPYGTIVVFNPDEDSDYFSTLYGHRQMAADGRTFSFLYGGVAQQDTNVVADATDLFEKDQTVDDVRKFGDQYHVNAIVVFATDPIWNHPASWVWKIQPAFQTDKSKVFLLSQTNGQVAP